MRKMPKYIKIPLVVLTSLVLLVFLLLVGVQCILSEKTLTGIVNRYAVQMVDANVHFGRVKLSLVENFPRASLTLEKVSVTYPSDRFSSESLRVAASQPADSTALVDTLASFNQLKVVLKISDLWEKGTIHVPFVELKRPRIFAKKYNEKANWDILKTQNDSLSVEDSLACEDSLAYEDSLACEDSSMPVIHINRVRLTDHPYVVYLAPQDSLFAVLRAKNIELRSNIRTDSLKYLRGRFTVDSLMVAGRLKKDTVFFGLQQLELRRRPDTVNVSATAKAALALASLGRTRVPMALDAQIVKEDSACYRLSLNELEASAYDIAVKAVGSAWLRRGEMGVDVRLGTADEKRLFAYLKGQSTRLEDGDESYHVDASFTSDLEGLLALMPASLPLSAQGVLEAKILGDIKKSQLTPSEFAKADLQGYVRSKHLKVDMPEDTIFVQLDTLNLRLAAEGRTFRQSGKTRRMLTLSTALDSVKVNYKNVFDVRGHGLAVRCYNSARAFTSPQKGAIYPFSGAVDIKSLSLKDSDGVVMVLKNSKESFSIRPNRANPKIPILSLRSNNGRFFYKSGADRMRLRNLGFHLTAQMNEPRRPGPSRDSLMRHRRRTFSVDSLPDYLSEKDFRKSDLHFSLPSTLEKYFKEWNLSGNLSLSRLNLVTPSFPLKTNVVNLGARFNNNTISLDSLSLVSGCSDLFIKGELDGLKRFLLGRGPIQLDLSLQSEELDCNELLAAWESGQRVSEEYKDSLSMLEDDAFDAQVAQIEVQPSDTASQLLVVPANFIANLDVDAGEIRLGDLGLYSVCTELAVQERCVRITNTMATSDLGDVLFEGFYSTRTKKDLSVGLNLSLSDVTADRVIELLPAVDTLMPMLSNFSGLLSCDLAIKSDLDTNMNLVLPTAKGVIRIEGRDLQIYDSPEFTKLAKILMFKEKNIGHVNHLKVEGNLDQGYLEIFPFVLQMDKYTLAMSGLQQVTSDFRYHVSLIKSPLLFKFGIDLWGNFDDWHFSLCKPKYKNPQVPAFSKVIDDVRIDLSKTIANVFKTGVEKAMSNEASQSRWAAEKKKQGYVPVTEIKSDSLSAAEMEKIRKAQQ